MMPLSAAKVKGPTGVSFIVVNSNDIPPPALTLISNKSHWHKYSKIGQKTCVKKPVAPISLFC
jgi:hypothetical protein